MADEGVYIVLSVADNGIVHAWGEGPCYDPSGKLVTPFASRARARSVLATMRRKERKEWLEDGEEVRVKFRVCKVIGIEPTPVP